MSYEEEDSEQTYEEAMREQWERLQEIDDPWERAVALNEWHTSEIRTPLSMIMVNAVAYQLAAESFK